MDKIIAKINPDKKSKTKISWDGRIVTAILTLLVIFSFWQTFQSAAILSKISSGVIKPASAASSDTVLPSNLQNLPNMVGGC